MYTDILCRGCGRCLGHLRKVYDKLKQEKIGKVLADLGIDLKHDLDPVYINIIRDFKIKTGKILDKLNVPNECCRLKFLCTVKFNDQVKEQF